MGTILIDNGGEFSSDEMREVASIQNVKVYTTADESPFLNGLYERVHEITDTMLMKLDADYRKMWKGFRSHQLVCGLNSNLPNILKDTLPALEGRTLSEEFAKHLNILHDSRKAYIQSDKAGKTTGKNKHWYNVQDDIDEDKKSVDLDKVWEKVTGDSDENEIGVNMTNSSFLNDEEIAKQTELSKLHNFDTYEECDDIGQNALSTRWVITTKDNQTKARLVV
ncbi:unnamed protein product [Mytilus coruscus]|uniref:Integrase catalytic domain-containing protein n=1 Tax=Mytilus coruscus TaxID=42192 RepID=A0A6J8BDV9_MYTCO|nr:unnamed protein product [Mytilus coruscus]